jgi:hypothetical protein
MFCYGKLSFEKLSVKYEVTCFYFQSEYEQIIC